MFDFDDAWKKTFSIYPKKTAYSTSKTAWMDKVLEVVEENQPDIARLLYKATEAYLSDYQEKNPDDTDFRYIPKYVDWLKMIVTIGCRSRRNEVIAVDRSGIWSDRVCAD